MLCGETVKAGRARRPEPRPCRWQGCLVRRRVDAARQPGNDRVALPSELGRQHPRHLDPGERSIARADDRDRRQRKDRRRSLDREQRRRIVHALQERRIVGLADADEAGAGAWRRPPVRPRPRSSTGCARQRPAPPEIISSGRISSAASADPKRLIRSRKVAGPTLGGADQAKPVQALAVAEARAGRLRFSLCTETNNILRNLHNIPMFQIGLGI